jgi:hypothetical protein
MAQTFADYEYNEIILSSKDSRRSLPFFQTSVSERCTTVESLAIYGRQNDGGPWCCRNTEAVRQPRTLILVRIKLTSNLFDRMKTPSRWEFGREVHRLSDEYREKKCWEDECSTDWELIESDENDVSDDYGMVDSLSIKSKDGPRGKEREAQDVREKK